MCTHPFTCVSSYMNANKLAFEVRENTDTNSRAKNETLFDAIQM